MERQCADTNRIRTILHSLSHSCSQGPSLSSFSPAVLCVLGMRKQSHRFWACQYIWDRLVSRYSWFLNAIYFVVTNLWRCNCKLIVSTREEHSNRRTFELGNRYKWNKKCLWLFILSEITYIQHNTVVINFDHYNCASVQTTYCLFLFLMLVIDAGTVCVFTHGQVILFANLLIVLIVKHIQCFILQ